MENRLRSIIDETLKKYRLGGSNYIVGSTSNIIKDLTTNLMPIGNTKVPGLRYEENFLTKRSMENRSMEDCVIIDICNVLTPYLVTSKSCIACKLTCKRWNEFIEALARVSEHAFISSIKSKKEFREVCERGRYLDVHNWILKYYTKKKFDYWLKWGLSGACKGGHIDIINLLIDKGATLSLGLWGACEGGNIEIINLMIDKGADNWDDGLRGACCGVNIEIINLIIDKGADDWDFGLWGACQGGHIDVVNLMISKGADNWDMGLQGACEGEHIEIVNLMIRRGANSCDYCENSKHPELL